MNIVIDFSSFIQSAAENPLAVAWYMFIQGGWAFVVFALAVQLLRVRQQNIEHRFLHKIKYILLAIDIPKLNEQSTKAVEQIFAQLAGAEDSPTLWEKYVHGQTQESFSIELVSIGGYIQFLIHTPDYFRDLIEAAIYAQYPDADITEVDDYTGLLPKKYPDEEYTLWGTELKLVKPNAYPIRTYPHFEHTLSQKFADPMAAMLEIMSHIGPGEQIWIQWVLTPIAGNHWKEEGEREVKKLIGAHVEHKKSFTEQWITNPLGTISSGTGEVLLHGLGVAPTHAEEHATNAPPTLMQHLSPSERVTVEAIGEKIAKIGFHVKGRIIYAAKKELYSKAKGVVGVLGAVFQFNDSNLNGFAPIKKITTRAKYFFTKRRIAARQRKILYAYRTRSKHAGWGHGMILNIEELATVWHFPALEVKAPSVQMMEAKKGEPPAELPFAPEEIAAVVEPSHGEEHAADAAPQENLPI